MLVMTRQRIRLLQIMEHCIGGSLMAKAASDQNTNTNTIGTVRNLMKTYTYLRRAFIEQETYLDIEKKKMKLAQRILFLKKTTHLQVYDPRIRPAGQNSTGAVFPHFSIFSLFFSFSFFSVFSATIQF